MDVQRSGKINIVAVRGFVKSMCPGVGDAQVRPVGRVLSCLTSVLEVSHIQIPPSNLCCHVSNLARLGLHHLPLSVLISSELRLVLQDRNCVFWFSRHRCQSTSARLCQQLKLQYGISCRSRCLCRQ